VKAKKELYLWWFGKQFIKLIRERKFKELRKHIVVQGLVKLKNVSIESAYESRERHTVVSNVAPNDEFDKDPYHLRDEQSMQLFWNVMVFELLGSAFWWRTSESADSTVDVYSAVNGTDDRDGKAPPGKGRKGRRLAALVADILQDATANGTNDSHTGGGGDDGSSTVTVAGGGGALVVTVLIKSLSIGAVCLIVLIGCRFVFRVGNRWLHRQYPSTSTRICGRTVTYSRGRIWAYTALILAWLANLALYACALWTAVAYGRFFDKDETEALLRDWLIGTAVAWLLIEPVQIVAIACFPCIFKSDACDKMQEWLACCGLDLSFFF